MSDATALMRHPCLMAGSPEPPVRTLLITIEVIRKSTILRKVQRGKKFTEPVCFEAEEKKIQESATPGAAAHSFTCDSPFCLYILFYKFLIFCKFSVADNPKQGVGSIQCQG